LTTKKIVSSISKIKKAFPTLESGFYDVLCESFKRNKFTPKEMEESVNFVIEHCKYPQPTIADFVNYNPKRNMPKYIDDYGDRYYLDVERGKYYNKYGVLYR